MIKDIFKEILNRDTVYDTHETDLYIPVTDKTTELIDNYEFKNNVTKFSSSGFLNSQWYDIPFAFDIELENLKSEVK